MNQLSKLLYWADVFGRLGPLLILIGILLLIAAGVTIGVYFENLNYNNDSPPALKKLFLGFGLSGIAFIIAFILIPSKETVYAIAASEVGEQVLKTPIVGKAEKALETWLDKQINAK